MYNINSSSRFCFRFSISNCGANQLPHLCPDVSWTSNHAGYLVRSKIKASSLNWYNWKLCIGFIKGGSGKLLHTAIQICHLASMSSSPQAVKVKTKWSSTDILRNDVVFCIWPGTAELVQSAAISGPMDRSSPLRAILTANWTGPFGGALYGV